MRNRGDSVVRRLLVSWAVAASVLFAIASPASAADPPGIVVQGHRIADNGDFGTMVSTAQHVYVSSDRDGSTVAIMNPDGSQDGSIRNLPGPSGLAVGGDTLYVATYTDSEIHRFDLSTDPPAELSPLSLQAREPMGLALAGGRLWYVAYDPDSLVVLGSIKPNGSDEQTFGGGGEWTYSQSCDELDSGPTAPTTIYVYSLCYSGDVAAYDVSSAPPTLIGDWGDFAHTYYAAGAAGSPDGLQALFSTGYRPMQLQAFPAHFDESSAVQATYSVPAGALVNGYALSTTSADGGWIASTLNTPGYERYYVALWRQGQLDPATLFTAPTSDGSISRHGIQFSPDGHQFYFVTRTRSGDQVFHVADADEQLSTLSLKASTTKVVSPHRILLSGTLTTGSTNRIVDIHRSVDGKERGVTHVEADQAGRFSLSVTPDAKTDFWATYDGGQGWSPSTTTPFIVTVQASMLARMLHAEKKSGRYHVYRTSQHVVIAGHESPAQKGKRIELVLQYHRRRRGWRSVWNKNFHQSSTGWISVSFTPGFPLGRWRAITRVGSGRDIGGASSDPAYFRVVKS